MENFCKQNFTPFIITFLPSFPRFLREINKRKRVPGGAEIIETITTLFHCIWRIRRASFQATGKGGGGK